MVSMVDTLKHLITLEDTEKLSSEDIVSEMCLRLYEEENWHIREDDIFSKLPTIIKDIILIIDLDTELNMNGILGFIQNSTGLYIDDTILTLERINAHKDYLTLKKIRDILCKYDLSTRSLRETAGQGELYEITSFSNIHNAKYDEVAKKIGIEAENLYLNSGNTYIYEYLIEYVERNRQLLRNSLSK